ncbi:uncharacterized protein LOC127725836 [Mytilus californianus]|uniref:uncharacterized protein LOC127725836 n=1 Tax=Mytilus californianus TaxID=6549 RepID=UPI002247BFDE|nr:uncharacterized protein LOC127725836 [Mytilus californianus]
MFLPLLFAVVLPLIAVQSNDNVQTYRINIKVPGGRVNEDVVVDSKANLMTVNVGDVSQLNNSYCPSINLHDFEKQKVAIKNIDHGLCLVIDTKESKIDSVGLFNKIERLHYQHEIKDEILVRAHPITPDEMLKIAGEKLAEFCRGYKLFNGERVQHDGVHIAFKKARRVKRSVRGYLRGCSFLCGWCIIGAS